MTGDLATCRHLKKAANFYGVSGCINVLFVKQIQEFSLLGHECFQWKETGTG